jgi:hypothetical protein
MSDPDLRDLLLEHARRRAAGGRGEPSSDEQWAKARAMLIAAFGEADIAAVEALGVEQEMAESNDK